MNEFTLRAFWTRLYIIDAVSGLPGPEATVTASRLMQNQNDIGNAIRPFYGVAAGDKLTALLHRHILGAVDVLTAALANDTSRCASSGRTTCGGRAANLPDLQAAGTRLFQHQTDIGNAIMPFYGQAAGTQLTNLLTTHIAGAVKLLGAVESGDTNAIASAKSDWYANGEDIAMFLAGANPNWPLNDAERHMKLHLDQTFAEAGAHLNGQWSDDATDYDIVVNHIRAMADFLSDGIAEQFSNQVK